MSSVSVGVGSDGTVFITGSFRGTTYFPTGPNSADDSIALQAQSPNGEIFVAALSADTSYFRWAQQVGATGGSNRDTAYSLAVTNDDTVLLTGEFDGTAYFPTGPHPADDSITINSRGGRDIFVAALNADDSYFAWAQRAGGASDSDFSYSVTVTEDDTVLVTGTFSGTTYFPIGAGDDSIALVSTSASFSSNLFVAAMNSDDSYFAWAQRAGGVDFDASDSRSVAVTEDNTVIVTGQFSGTTYFPIGPGDDSVALVAKGSTDMFVAAMNSDDSYFTWAQHAGGDGSVPADADGRSVAITRDGSPIIVGTFDDTVFFPTGPGDDSIALVAEGSTDMFVAAMNADDSYFAWAQSAGGMDTVNDTAEAIANSVAITADDTILVAGTFYRYPAEGTLSFPTGAGDDSISLSSPVFVAALAPGSEYFAWAQGADGNQGSAGGNAIASTLSNTAVVTGELYSSLSFPSSPDQALQLTASGAGPSAFVGQLALIASPQPTPTPPTPVTYPPSSPRDAAATAGEASATVTWIPPASSGSFPITTYQAASSPGGKTCLVAAPSTSCTIDGLTNGNPYTFRVRALNGAGWSPDSAPSAPVTPKAPTSPTIVITGSRGTAEGRIGRVIVDGVTTDLAGALVQSRVHLAGEVDYYDGSTRRVSDDETFTWQRKTKKKVYVYFITEDASVRSNRLIINP